MSEILLQIINGSKAESSESCFFNIRNKTIRY